jgi:hypothetical protein
VAIRILGNNLHKAYAFFRRSLESQGVWAAFGLVHASLNLGSPALCWMFSEVP